MRVLVNRYAGHDAPLFVAAWLPSVSLRTFPYSHSIINEPSKLLIRRALASASQIFTVIFTANLPGTSIGADLRAIRPEATFRDLSTSIDSRDHRGYRRRRIGVGQGNDQEGLASNASSYCRD